MLNRKKWVYWASVIFGGLFLIQYWLKFFIYLENNNVWGHKNYWGASVGTYLLLAILLAATPAYLIFVYKSFPKTEAEDDGKSKKNSIDD